MTGLPAILEQPLTDDERARVEANLGLIRFVINRHGRNYITATYTEDDAFQDGLIGLCIAIRKHDPARGTLGTMSMPWIQQAIERGRGTAEGINQRRATVTRTAYQRPISIDQAAPTEDGDTATVVDHLAATDDPETDALEDDRIAWIRRHVCRTNRDRLIFDQILAAEAPATQRELAAAAGVTQQAIQKATRNLVARIAAQLDPLRQAS